MSYLHGCESLSDEGVIRGGAAIFDQVSGSNVHSSAIVPIYRVTLKVKVPSWAMVRDWTNPVSGTSSTPHPFYRSFRCFIGFLIKQVARASF